MDSQSNSIYQYIIVLYYSWLLHATPEQIDETLNTIVPMVQDETIISYCKRFSMEELPFAVKYANFPYNYRTVVLFMEA